MNYKMAILPNTHSLRHLNTNLAPSNPFRNFAVTSWRIESSNISSVALDKLLFEFQSL